MFLHELEYFPSFLEKMPTAFFRISRSMQMSASSLRDRAFSVSSGLNFFFPLPGKLAVSLDANSLPAVQQLRSYVQLVGQISDVLPFVAQFYCGELERSVKCSSSFCHFGKVVKYNLYDLTYCPLKCSR